MELSFVSMHNRHLSVVLACHDMLQMTIPLSTRIILLLKKKKPQNNAALHFTYHLSFTVLFLLSKEIFSNLTATRCIALPISILQPKKWRLTCLKLLMWKTKTMFQNPDHHPVVKIQPALHGGRWETDWLQLFSSWVDKAFPLSMLQHWSRWSQMTA